MLIITIFFINSTSLAEKEENIIQIFVQENCNHCIAEKEYLKSKNISYREINIKENLELYEKVSSNFNVFGSPITLAGNKIFQGYSNDKLGEKIIESYKNSEIKYSFESALKNEDKIGVYGVKSPICDDNTSCEIPEKQLLSIPFYGEVPISTESKALRYSFSFLLGFLDGFNPCAMWVLIMFIITLIQVGDRLKMVFVAGTFLIAEALMYGLILILWWKFFNMFSLEYNFLITIFIIVLALCAGIFFIWEGVFTDGTCKVTSLEQQRTISQKISSIANSPITWVSFGGILLLAFSVNVIEFACSAGYPQVFTNILNSISGDMFHKMGLLLTYMSAYMLDDLIVFAIALFSIEKLGVMQKHARGLNIFGGVIMILIALWMAFSIL